MLRRTLLNHVARALKVTLLATLILGVNPPIPVHATETIPYRVVPGDNLTSIVERFGTSLLAIHGANKLKNQVLVPGQLLQIPILTGTIHTVTHGETLIALANVYGSTVDAIMAENFLTWPTIINGMRLAIPTGAPSAPAPAPEPEPPATVSQPAASGGLAAPPGAETAAQAVIIQPEQLAKAEAPQTAREKLAATNGQYIVQPLDSIDQIAAKFNVPPYVLRRFNKLRNNSTLRPGQKLNIPAPLGTPYLVKPGESLMGLALRSNTNILTIMALNGMTIPLLMERSEVALPPACLPAGVAADPGSRGFGWPTTYHSRSGNSYSNRHRGYDVTAPYNTPVYASKGGIVALAQWTEWGFGNTIVLDHDKGWQTLYAHLDSIAVTCGQTVAKGDLLGISGSTGNSTGPHLHFEIMQRESHVNPADYLFGG
jgi:murein DD-endopeptidase MepM/ murein hydrolase activator NlpD